MHVACSWLFNVTVTLWRAGRTGERVRGGPWPGLAAEGAARPEQRPARMSTRVAPSTPSATAKADGDASSTGPPAEGRYGSQRFFGEESCFAVVVCWPASPLVVPLLLLCGLDTRTVWIAADGTMWEVRVPNALAGGRWCSHVRFVAAAAKSASAICKLNFAAPGSTVRRTAWSFLFSR